MKAQFDNRDQRLWPGAFVGVRLAVRTLEGCGGGAAGGDRAIAARAVVFVVEEGSRVAARPVQVLRGRQRRAAVQGLAGGEGRIVLARAARTCGRATWWWSRSAGSIGGRSSPDAAGIGAMNLSELFIRRPVTTVLLNLAIVLAGVIAYHEDPGGGAAELQHAGHQRGGAAAGRRA